MDMEETILQNTNKIEDADCNEEIVEKEEENEEQLEQDQEEEVPPNENALHAFCLSAQQNLRADYEVRMEQLRVLLEQKENTISLLQRERNLLEKEKQTYYKEMESAKKEKETTVIKFANQEKLVINAKKDRDAFEKQLLDAKRKMEANASAFQAALAEKSRMAGVIDRKCQEIQKQLREHEKLKSDYNHLASKLKYTTNKLKLETEARIALEKKLEEQPSKLEEKANGK